MSENNNHDYIAQSLVMRELMAKLEKVAKSDIRILLLGETGVGKSLIARHIHELRFGKDCEMVSVSGGQLSNDLADSMLFGHSDDAYTGAKNTQMGYFELANKNSLFLDEITDLRPDIEAKILTALDKDGEFHRVGETKTRHSHPRIIAASNRDISDPNVRKEIKFRDDLYERLAGYVITIPPLRERPEDILAIADHYLKKMNEKYDSTHRLDSSALLILQQHRWPGNIRELEKTIELSVVLANDKSTVLTKKDIQFQAQTTAAYATSGLSEMRRLEEHNLYVPGTLMHVKIAGERFLTALMIAEGESCNVKAFAEKVGISVGAMKYALHPTDENTALLSQATAQKISTALDSIFTERNSPQPIKEYVQQAFQALNLAHTHFQSTQLERKRQQQPSA